MSKKTDASDEIKSEIESKSKKYIQRNIIKLGSSLAVTFPKEFFKSFRMDDKDDDEGFKNIVVHAYKVDPNSILIKKYKADLEQQRLDIDTNSFPIELLENLLISARKLNVNEINIYYQEKDYDKCLEIVNKFGSPVHSENKMTLDLSKIYKEFKFSDQVMGMIKNFSKIIDHIMDEGKIIDSDMKKIIETYLKSIESSYNEALRVLIIRLKNYYLWEDHPEEGQSGFGMSNIINTLGNRVLIAYLKDVSVAAANLFYSKASKEIAKYLPIIKIFPDLLKEEVELLLSPLIQSKIEEINNYKTRVLEIRKKYNRLVPDKNQNYPINEYIINSIIDHIFDIIIELIGIILTRWIEKSVKLQ